MANLVFGYDDKKEREKICTHLLEKVPSITTLLYTINSKWNDTIYDIETNIVSGRGYIIEKLMDFSFIISPKSFFQTNTKQAEKLYSVVKDFAALKGNENVYDLYCGTGSIGIYLSKNSKKIIGVDIVEDAIKDAKENVALNKIEHASFFCGDVIEICNEAFFNLHGHPDIIIVDPPRAGLHAKFIQKIIEISPEKLIYVSCNVATQARDLQFLSEKYSVEKLQSVDMFPHTHHIECVASLKLK
jgi:23S rRNA (uracil1939-C5)-methyltransferase